jgi:hypothetical protein
MGKSKLRKRLAREQRAAINGLRERVAASGIGQLPLRERPPPGKISVRLLDLVTEELQDVADIDSAKALIGLCAIGWNMAADPTVGEEQRAELLRRLPPEGRADAHQLLARVKERKLELFPEDLRVVVRTEAHRQADRSFFYTAAAVGYEKG